MLEVSSPSPSYRTHAGLRDLAGLSLFHVVWVQEPRPISTSPDSTPRARRLGYGPETLIELGWILWPHGSIVGIGLVLHLDPGDTSQNRLKLGLLGLVSRGE